MKHLLSKDLGLIFLLTLGYIIIISFPNLYFNKSFLELGFLILLFLFAGYSLISLLRPEENYSDILRKPILILEFSALIILAVSVILKFSALNLHLLILDNVMSIITLVLAISAYIRRIGYYKSNGKKNVNRDPVETSIPPKEDNIPSIQKNIATVAKPTTISRQKFKFNLIYDLILIDLLSIFAITAYFIHYLNINLVHNVIGIIYLLFIPGYVLMSIIVPKKGLGTIIRLGLSVGVSLPITSLIGLVLYYTKYGIGINTLIIPLAILTLILSTYAIKRRIMTS